MPRPGRRPSGPAQTSGFRIGDLLVQPDRLTVQRERVSIALEPRCMDVLVTLAERAGDVVSADQLLIEVWRGTFYGDNPVHKTIALLRRQLGDDSRHPTYIETIRKRGYRILAPVVFPQHYRSAGGALAEWTGGNPYRGLQAFGQDDAAIFFGRGRPVARVVEALRGQLHNQRRFVLVSGASGCGKTSLLRAGVIPLLRQPGGIDGLEALSVAQCDLSVCRGADVLDTLASALAQWTLHKRPVFLPAQCAQLAGHLVEEPAWVAARIDEAVRRLASRQVDGASGAHLLLVIDHAEALLGLPDAHELPSLQRAIAGLCAHPRVMVVMLVRSDFHPALVEALPLLAELKRGEGHLDLLPPQPGEIAQIIRLPARSAGLVFEEDADRGGHLDDVLLAAATHQPDVLPLLQHVLHGLYERRADGGVLTFAAYHALGGLEGALAQAAEDAFATVSRPAREALDVVLGHLVVVHPDTGHVTARQVPWQSLTEHAARELAEAFIRARLFVGDLGGHQPGVAVAHESLLRQWPRAQAWVRDNQHLLQVRERLQWAAQRWHAGHRRRDLLLGGGLPLREAHTAARRLPRPLDDRTRAYLRASQRAQRQRRWLRLSALALLGLLGALAVMLGLQARHAQRVAEARHEEAQQLVTWLLGDLAEQLRRAGNLKLLDSVGHQALAYLERLPPARMQAREQASRARALRTVGEIMFERGEFAAAAPAFQRAHAMALQATREDPGSTEALAERGLVSYWLGNMAYRQRDYAGARPHWDDYLDSTHRLHALSPDDPHRQLELSYALSNLGSLARAERDHGRAMVLFARSAMLKRQVLAARPQDASVRYELIDTLSWLSSSRESLGRLADAEAEYRSQIDMLRQLLGDADDALAWRRMLAASLQRTSALALALGRPPAAAADADESRRILRAVLSEHPDNAVWRRDLANACEQVARVALLRGEDIRAADAIAEGRALITPLLSSQAPPEWHWLGAMLELRSAQLAAIRRPDAMADADRAIDRLDALHQARRNDRLGRTLLADALVWRGERHRALGADAAATADWRRTVDLLGTTAQHSHDRHVLAPWLRAQLQLGNRLQVAPQLARLRGQAYRHPEFTELYDLSHQEMQTQ